MRHETYDFLVVVKPDEDQWIAYCPALVKQGAATWDYTREEASSHIREVLEMVIEDLLEFGIPIPEPPPEEASALPEERLAVTV